MRPTEKEKFSLRVIKKHPTSQARVTVITTPHGEVTTPLFMPVATRAFMNHMTVDDLRAAGSQLILGGNTYHMLCAPGMDVIRDCGGMHRFMHWSGPMLTDSGGFQIFSLSSDRRLCKIDEHGASFRLPNSGTHIRMTPASAMETQRVIGADIVMAFDQCTRDESDRMEAVHAMTRTYRWLLACKEYHTHFPLSHYGHYQALFGIIQGGSFMDLREECAQQLIALDLDGIAFGGETIGFNMPKTIDILRKIVPYLPTHKPRYTMGLGLLPQNLLDAVYHGADLFDCVAPTRNARHGTLYAGAIVKKGDWLAYESIDGIDKLLIKKKVYERDQRAIVEGCSCTTCQHYTRAYLHYLFKIKSPFYHQLACIHNVHVMHAVCQAMRDCIKSLA